MTIKKHIRLKNIYAILICSFKVVPQQDLQHAQQLLQKDLPAQHAADVAIEKHIIILI